MVGHGHFACIEQLFAQAQTNYNSRAKKIIGIMDQQKFMMNNV